MALRTFSSRLVFIRAPREAPEEVRCLPLWLNHGRRLESEGGD